MTLPITQVANIDIGIAQCICTVGINVDFQILGRPRIKLPITQVANNGIGMESGQSFDILREDQPLLVTMFQFAYQRELYCPTKINHTWVSSQ